MSSERQQMADHFLNYDGGYHGGRTGTLDYIETFANCQKMRLKFIDGSDLVIDIKANDGD